MLVVGARPVVVIDYPGGAVRSAGPMNEAAVTGGLASPEAPDLGTGPLPCASSRRRDGRPRQGA